MKQARSLFVVTLANVYDLKIFLLLHFKMNCRKAKLVYILSRLTHCLAKFKCLFRLDNLYIRNMINQFALHVVRLIYCLFSRCAVDVLHLMSH